MNDYVYQLTDLGRERARSSPSTAPTSARRPCRCTTTSTASSEQTLTNQHPTEEDLHRAFRRPADRQEDARARSARPSTPAAACSSSARRATARRASPNASPRPSARRSGFRGRSASTARSSGCSTRHARAKCRWTADDGLLDQRKIDRRWVRIRRPTIVVGGELTMDRPRSHAEHRRPASAKRPLQLKSNCGTLVIDDFGRQRMSADELLNRWIVPLEKRYDFLNLPSGKKIQVPFDQLIVFSTNLEPKDLVDDAFLRRIPYKIEVTDPGPRGFRSLLKIMAEQLGVEYDEAADQLPHREALQERSTAPSAAASRATSCCRSATTAATPTTPAEADAGKLRLRRRELLRGDVSSRHTACALEQRMTREWCGGQARHRTHCLPLVIEGQSARGVCLLLHRLSSPTQRQSKHCLPPESRGPAMPSISPAAALRDDGPSPGGCPPRPFLAQSGVSLGAMALSSLLARSLPAAGTSDASARRDPQFRRPPSSSG